LSAILQFAPGTWSKLNLGADCLIVAGGAAVSTLHSTGSQLQSGMAAMVALGVWLVGARVARHYNERCDGILAELALCLVLVAGVALMLRVMQHLFPVEGRSLSIGAFFLLSWPGVWFVRAAVIVYRSWYAAPPRQVLIVGTGDRGRAAADDIRDSDGGRQVVAGFLTWDGDVTPQRALLPLLGSSRDLEATLKGHAIAEVYFAGTQGEQADAMQAGIGTCEVLGVPFAFPAFQFRHHRSWPINGNSDTDGYMHFQQSEPKPLQIMLKRLLDIVASAVALWVLSPLLLLSAVAIMVTSPGPVFFKQERVGLHGRTFFMLKFRSMVANAEALKKQLLLLNEQSGPVFKIRKDPRITPAGRFFRKFSIDELPQLINVLRGDMSLVGPRPPLPSEVAQYEPWQRRRLSVRPGLTCLWQVSGRNGIGFLDWMKLDMQYIDQWSFTRDLGLILRTVPVVLMGRDAS
jgi:exopolysaccharide biosynthesis polyprenyl glycosylphosphotransferase